MVVVAVVAVSFVVVVAILTDMIVENSQLNDSDQTLNLQDTLA